MLWEGKGYYGRITRALMLKEITGEKTLNSSVFLYNIQLLLFEEINIIQLLVFEETNIKIY